MAPPPEYDKEPKAPDKSVTNISTEDSKVVYNHIKDPPASTEHKIASTIGNVDVENNKHVETLDDGQLRALLDEAITYKCPKDREGKSSLFKELLESVEQDEQACEAAARGLGAGRSARRGRARREHHSSLQDLVAAMAGEAAGRRGRAHAHAHAPAPPAGTVSARALHGGSLPSGVDTSFLLGEEAGVGMGAGAPRGGYLATVRCVNPPPLAERRVSTGDANPPQAQPQPQPAQELDVITRRSKPMFPMTYTARATLEIGSGSVCTGRAVTTTTASNQVDSAIPFSCITTPEVVASCNTTSSTSQSTVAVDAKPLQLVSSYRAVACLMDGACQPRPPSPPLPLGHSAPLASPAHSIQPRGVISSSFNGLPLARPSAADDYKKSLDENGNAVQGFGSPLAGSGQHKKPRRKKSSKNETVIKSHQIDGYQGNKDLNEVLRFIESNAEGARAPKLRPPGKKRSTERRKDKESKVKRASSLEELSRTTLEDLTDKPAARRADAPAKPERRSWGEDARALLRRPPAPEPDPPPELADFQTVTKKRKPRRRADDAERAPSPPRRTRAPSPRARASAPASDRSNDSNDDTDCAHSPPPAPAAPPPHASYADIARTRHNIPDLIESCNFYGEGDEAPPVAAGAPPDDSEQYPALAAVRARDKPPAPPAPAARKEPPAPDVVADRRPPVVLLAAGARPRELDGVTFGFDVNEQLLGARCDLLEHGAPAVRYEPPDPPLRTAQLQQIVDYVATAWEDVMRGGGKVHYFSECVAPNN